MRTSLKFIFLVYTACYLTSALTCYSQCTPPNFSIPSNGCINEQLSIVNESTDVTDLFEWDFCDGDLFNVPNGNQLSQITQLNGLTGIQLATENDNHYIFLTGRTGNHLVRLDLGNNLLNPNPSVVNLGSLGGVLNGPIGIRILKEHDNWYGLVYNSGNDNLVRISFGASLANNSPVAENVVKAFGGVNNGFDLKTINGQTIAAITNPSTNKVTLIDFGNSINNNPVDPTNILTSNAMPGASLLRGISLIQMCNNWYGFAVTSGNRKIYRLDFGANLFSVPSIVDITGTFSGVENFVDIKVFHEAGSYIGFILTTQGVIYKLDFGVSIVNLPAKVNLGNLGVISSTLYFDFVANSSRNYFFTGNTGTRHIYRGDFPDNCSSSVPVSNEFWPHGVKYLASGNYFTTLKSTTSSGVENHLTKSITIQDLQAPNISISSYGVCKSNSVQFNFDSDPALTSVLWEFGDGATSGMASPSHIYTTSGEYLIKFNGTAQNGCNNYTSKRLKIYDDPVPGFNVVSGLVCTHNNYLFSNTTLDNFDGNLSYQWLENDQLIGTDRDLNYEFTTTGVKEIKLITSIPGCSSEIAQTIPSVMDGPELDFLIEGHCEVGEVSFTNYSPGDVVSFDWDFGDGQSSYEINPTHIYQLTGNFQVTLQANSPNGCQNTKTKPITIYSKPQPNFQLELPPFSCSGMPSQFTDLSPSPVDSNIIGWSWSFGDDGSGTNTSTLKNPTHIYDNAGQYDVTLTAETNYGCMDSITKTVTIAQTPAVEILNTPACDDVPTTFSTSSSSDLQSWNWQIGITQFSIPEPTYLFTNPGSYTVSLDALGANNCIASTSKSVIVPKSLIPDFTVDKNCVGQPAEFHDVTVLYDDPIATYSWNFGDAGSGSGSPVLHSYQSTGNYDVNLNLITLSGCTYSRMKSIAVGNPPQASFTASPDVGVPPLNVNFINTSSGASQYLWNFNDGNNTTSTETSPQFTFMEYGNYVVDLTAYNAQNCSHTVSKVVTAALPYPDVGLENLVVSENADGLLSGRVVIHNKGNITIQNLNLAIGLSGIEIQQIVTEPIPPYSSILYTLNFNLVKGNKLEYICIEAELTGDNNKEDNSLCTSFENEIIVIAPYPNPTSGSLRVDWISPDEHGVQIFIHDPLGRLVFENKVESSPGLNSVSLNLEGLTQGAYVMSFNAGYSRKVFRFVVNR